MLLLDLDWLLVKPMAAVALNNMVKNYIIGIDGGGTGSSALIAQSDGKILEKRNGCALNFYSVGKKNAERNLKALLLPFFKKYKGIKTAVFGFAGLDAPKDFFIYKRMAKQVLPKGVDYLVYNDAETAIENVCPFKFREGDAETAKILVISGTGATVFGEFKFQKAKSVGWEFLLGDEGSAYWMGISALRAAVRSWDGRGQKTNLEKLILKQAGEKDMFSFLPKIYEEWRNKPGFKKYIASVSLVVEKACRAKDPLAKKIIKEGADELALGVKAVIYKLGAAKAPIWLGFVGSNFKTPKLQKLLIARIKQASPQTQFNFNVNPSAGALNLARSYFIEKKAKTPFVLAYRSKLG